MMRPEGCLGEGELLQVSSSGAASWGLDVSVLEYSRQREPIKLVG